MTDPKAALDKALKIAAISDEMKAAYFTPVYAAIEASARRPAMTSHTWESDPDYPRAEWVAEVVNGDTQRGYWEWVEWCRGVDRDDQ